MMNKPGVHGSIFYLLKKFVVQAYSLEMWNKLNTEANTLGEYTITKSYPLSEIESIVSVASKHTGISVNDLKEKFGEFLVPDLFALYKNYIDPDWKTFDVLINTEEVMHGAVRKLNSTANPPILNVSKIGDDLLIIDYHSRRRMGTLAVGIIKGIADYYNEKDIIRITPTTDPDAERVQIRVERIS